VLESGIVKMVDLRQLDRPIAANATVRYRGLTPWQGGEVLLFDVLFTGDSTSPCAPS
jgi:hypothetical protein